jgi:hypothetical protein
MSGPKLNLPVTVRFPILLKYRPMTISKTFHGRISYMEREFGNFILFSEVSGFQENIA